MFIRRYVALFTLVVTVTRNGNCSRMKRNTLSDIFDFNNIEKISTKLIDNVKKTQVIRLNDFISIETNSNATNQLPEGARLLDKLEDIANTKSLNVNLGPADLKLSRDGRDLNFDVKLDARKSKGGKGGNMLLPILIGLKATTFIFAVVSLVGLFTLKAFIASKTAILIAVILGLKKIFGENHKTTYEAVHEHHPVPVYHQYTDLHYEPEMFKGHAEIPDHKLVEIYELAKDQNELGHENKDVPKYEFQEQEAISEPLKGHDFHGVFGGNTQEFNHEVHQRRRNWKNNGKRKPLSLIVGIPHQEPPVLAYKKIVAGRSK